MSNRIICLIITMTLIFSVCPSVWAADGEAQSETIINNGSITMNMPVCTGNIVALSGIHADGAGEYITVKITDDIDGAVYAMTETRSKMGGNFSVECGLRSEAYNKELKVCVSDGRGSFSEAPVKIEISTSYNDFIAVDSITNTDKITLNDPACGGIPVVISGTHADGAGETVQVTVTNSADKNLVYATSTARTTSGGEFTFSVTLPEASYGKTLTAYVKCSRTGSEACAKFYFTGGHGGTKSLLGRYATEIEDLMAKCEQKGIPVEYERVSLNVIKRFNSEKFLDYYAAKALAKEYDYNKQVLIDLAEETIADLNAYLNGSKLAKNAPIYVSSDVEEDEQSLIADVRIDGEIKRQPVFFNGYGHWGDSFEDHANFTELGINFAHFEVGPNSILKEGTNGNKYDVIASGVERVKNIYKIAEENNISLLFGSSPHYFPQFIYKKYPEINNNGNGSFPSYVPWNPTHDEVKEVIEKFLRAVLPEIKDYKSFHSICIANEPFFIVSEYPDYYLPAYREFIRNKYNNDVSKLKGAYGTSYSSFDTLTMPKSVGATARYNDWREFNDSILTEWFTWMVDIIHDIDETIPVWAKCSAYISSGGNGARRVFCGSNYEQWSEIFDINGCDAWGIYGENQTTVQGKMMWYDFMTSLRNAPIINGEDHILRDNPEITYKENEFLMNRTDIWQGAIHGRAASAYWLWDKSTRSAEGSIYYNSNLTRRADLIAEIGKLNLEMNRLANEITAIQQKDARCAVLYSNYSQNGNYDNGSTTMYHSAAMYEAYRCLLNNGEKVYIANDTYPERINENENLELLIVPACEYMPEAVWQEIKEFEERGKKVIFADVRDYYKTENGNNITSSLKNDVLSKATCVKFSGWNKDTYRFSNCSAVYDAIESAISKFSNSITAEVSSIDVEWTAAEYEGDYVINLCNYGETEADINLGMKGKNIAGDIFDLTENEETDASFTLLPYEFKMIRISGEAGRIWYETNENGKVSSKACVNAEANAPFVHVLALYGEDGNLIKVFAESGNADSNGLIETTITEDVSGAAKVRTYLFDSMSTICPYLKAKDM